MTEKDIAKERRRAVSEAWKTEKSKVLEGKGTRDWSQKEQKEIISKNHATGYQGHHMKSVHDHNSKAGDANNIQFLTRKEHLAAHRGNFKNSTNGYYNPKTGEMNDFGKKGAHIEERELSKPLSDSQKSHAMSKERNLKNEKIKSAKERAKNIQKRDVKKITANKKQSNSKIESKTLSSQRAKKAQMSNKSETSSKTLSSQRSVMSKSSSTGRTASTGKSTSSGKTASVGSSVSSSQGLGHGGSKGGHSH